MSDRLVVATDERQVVAVDRQHVAVVDAGDVATVRVVGEGPQGPKGATGDKGNTGDTGPVGVEEITVTAAEFYYGGIATPTGGNYGASATNRVPVRVFPDSADTWAMATVGVLPPGWESIDLYLEHVNPAASTGDVRWTVYPKVAAVGGTFTGSKGATSVIEPAAGQYARARVQVGTEIPVAPGQSFGIGLNRGGNNAADTLAGPIGLFAICIRKAGT